jgi:hypothetical protein
LLREQLSPEAAIATCTNSGFQIAGIGSHGRIAVMSTDDHVYKLAWREQGILDNTIEYNLYQMLRETAYGQFLAPTVSMNQAGIVKQRYAWLIGRDDPDHQHMIKTVVNHLAQIGISDVGVNLGFIEDNLVCYDYALISSDLYQQLFEKNRSRLLTTPKI